jgi:colanic acid biosynthesis glycosyl transferase WcaI
MRVLILTQYYLPEVGAAQTRLAAFARELRRRSHDVEVVTAMPNHLTGRTLNGYRGKVYVREDIDGVAVQRTWVYAATGTGLPRVFNYISFTITSLFAILRARRPDLIFVESPPLTLGVAGWLASVYHRAPMVFNVSDLWPDAVRDLGVVRGGPVLRAAELLEAWIYRRASLVNAVTDSVATVLRTAKRVPESKIRFLPNGVDIERFYPQPPDDGLRERLGLGDKPVLLYAGTHGIGMGLDHLVDAASLLAEEAVVLFVGAGPVKPALVNHARRIGTKNVLFVDPVPLEEMPAYLSISRAAVVTLVRAGVRRGARPAKIFPALASGIPIIYSGDGEGADLVEQAGAGMVVAPEDPHAIAGAMRALIADPELHDEMSRNARNVAVERFQWSSIVEQWLCSIGAVGTVERAEPRCFVADP